MLYFFVWLSEEKFPLIKLAKKLKVPEDQIQEKTGERSFH